MNGWDLKQLEYQNIRKEEKERQRGSLWHSVGSLRYAFLEELQAMSTQAGSGWLPGLSVGCGRYSQKCV